MRWLKFMRSMTMILIIAAVVEALYVALRQDGALRSGAFRYIEMALLVSVILLAATAMTAFTLQRWHMGHLKIQAANERLIAAIALPLIEADNSIFATRVLAAAEKMAPHIHARQLHLSIPDLPNFPGISWPRSTFDASWLNPLLEAAEADGAWNGCSIIVSRSSGATPQALGKAMLDLGVHDLVLLRTVEPFRVVVGFEPERPAKAGYQAYSASIGAAMVVIAHGARREAAVLDRDRLERSRARARRMETIGGMASGTAHNFNNILGAISGFAEIGHERSRTGSAARNSFDEILDAVGRGRGLVEDILGFARERPAAKQVIHLGNLLQNAVRLLTALARDDGVYLLRLPQDPLYVFGAVSDLEQAIINVCNNAFSAGNGRRVTISVSSARIAAEQQMSHGPLEAGSYSVVEIADEGGGVREAAFHRLFEPFFTTKAAGTGLGLSTAWKIVHDHGGTIDVHNNAEGGATFSLWIPEISLPTAAMVPGIGRQVLVVAEAKDIAEQEELIAELGYEPIGFALPVRIETLIDAVATCDAAVISAVCGKQVEALARGIEPVLGHRPLLLAASDVSRSSRPIGTSIIDYPLNRAQVDRMLSVGFPRE